MRASKRFTVFAIGLWLVACIISCLSVPLAVIFDAQRDMSALRNVLANADRAIDGGRTLVIGSSPSEMGLSAKQIGQETGRPSFNLAIENSAEFFEDYLREIEPHLRKGDVVVVSNPAWLDLGRATLPLGCVNRFRFDCLVAKFVVLPHLNVTIRFLLGALWSVRASERYSNGDVVALRSSVANHVIDPLAPAEIVTSDLGKMTTLIARFRARGACPLLAIGPILVSGKQQASWVDELGSLQNAAYKAGLGRYILSDGVAQVDSAAFLDSFEHLSPSGRAQWTRRVIDRLNDREMHPCASVMAGE